MKGRAVYLEAISAKPQRNSCCEFDIKVVQKGLIMKALDRWKAFVQNRAFEAAKSRLEATSAHLLADVGLADVPKAQHRRPFLLVSSQAPTQNPEFHPAHAIAAE